MTGLGATAGMAGEAGRPGAAAPPASAGATPPGARAGPRCGRAGRGGPRGRRRHARLGCRRAVAERGVRADLVVVTPPALDHDLGLAQAVKDLAVEQLVAEPGVEALHVPVLPRAARGDVGGPGTDRRDPFLDRLGRALGAVVGADVARHAAQDEEIRE